MDGYLELTIGKLGRKEGVAELNRMLKLLFDHASSDGNTVRVYQGYGSPENVISAGVGSVYQRLDGGAGTSVYIKESGSGDTGWIAK